jgi:hypothetical protein
MSIHIPELSGIILTYLLVFSRVGAMVMLLPAIGDMGVPSRVRLVLALAIAFALTPQVQGSYPAAAPQTTVALVIMIAAEVTAGVLVGSMARIIMSALQVAGYLIATQTGLGLCPDARSHPEHARRGAGKFHDHAGHGHDLHDQPASPGDWRHCRQLSDVAARRGAAHRRHGAVGDQSGVVIFRAGLSARRALPGVRLRHVCGPGHLWRD